MIHALVGLAVKEKDHATFEMLQGFVKEQVEEEADASYILAQNKKKRGTLRDTSFIWTPSSGNGNNRFPF